MRSATHLRADHIDAGIHRAGEEEIGCRRGGSSDCCQKPERESRSIGTGGKVSRSYRYRGAPLQVHLADAETELVRLRAQVAELQVSTRVERPRVRVSPAEMPWIPGEFSAWMADRQKDMQEALNTGDHSRVIELSSMLTVGAERMVEMTRPEISDDEFRSRTAPGEGRFAPC